ncbi:MAG: helix-turn-helix domain-containing protein, partial [Rhizobiales bacterium]|nr:helix-turn-helix domain-containing protein [Hyphomicrobiales bacterium]
THFDEPIRLSDIVEIAGVPGRTLNSHFREFTGYSPMAYLTNLRLRQARQALKTGGQGDPAAQPPRL